MPAIEFTDASSMPMPRLVENGEPPMSVGGHGYELQKLAARHRAMVNYFLAGWTQKDVAERFGMTLPGINIIYNSTLFQQELLRRQKELDDEFKRTELSTVLEAKQHLEEHALDAAEKLVELAKSSDQKIALASTNSILDRCFGTEKKNNEQQVGFKLSDVQIENLQIVLNESKKTV